MQQDERIVLTTREIEQNLRGNVIVAVFALVLTLFYFGLAVAVLFDSRGVPRRCAFGPVDFKKIPSGKHIIKKRAAWALFLIA